MATLSEFPTLIDLAKSWDPDGRPARLVELLSLTNPIIPDLPIHEGNLPTGHQHSVRTGLPKAFWRKAYQGVPVSKSARATVTDTIGSLHARAEVDAQLSELNGNSAAFRLSEGKAFIEAMNQEMASTVFYGNTAVQPERFMGLAPRYNDLTTAESKRQILDAGGTGSNDNTSVWIVGFGEDGVCGIYPKGSTAAGLTHKDLGEGDAFDGDGNRYRALMEMYRWDLGLTVRDWRKTVRIANVKVADLPNAGLSGGGTQALTAATNLVRLIIEGLGLIHQKGTVKLVGYAPRSVLTALTLLAYEKSSPHVTLIQSAAQQFGPVAGYELMVFGVPFRQCDALLETEARVV